MNSVFSAQSALIPATRKVRRAVSVLEAGFYLLIFITFIGSVMSMVSSRMTQSDAALETQNIINLSAAVMGIKGANGYPTTEGAIVQALLDLGQLPTNISYSGTDLTNTWGGQINVSVEASGAGFSIEYTGVPAPECKLLVRNVKESALRSVTSSSGSENIRDVDASFIDDACSDTGSNTVSWSTIAV